MALGAPAWGGQGRCAGSVPPGEGSSSSACVIPAFLLSLESLPVIAAPSMWTRPQIKDFKEKIRQDADSVITVGRGEVVTVRVPTHEEGSYLFWEFATDNYDIGFGVYFEWTDSPNTAVSVHVSESSDDDEEEEGKAVGPQWQVPRGVGGVTHQPASCFSVNAFATRIRVFISVTLAIKAEGRASLPEGTGA